MGINITLNTAETTVQEWRALVAFASLMTGGELIAPEKIADKMLTGEDFVEAYIVGRNSSTRMPPAGTENDRRETPVPLHPADNPAAGIDAELASFALPSSPGFNVPNAPGGTVTGASTAAAPVAGAAPSLPPAMPPVPAAPGTVAAPPASLVPLDKNGLPWDSRIHASTKTQNADATWRNKRGVSDEEIARVTAELRQVMAIPGPAAAVPAPPAPPVPGAPPGVPAAPAGPMTFIKLMPKVTAALTSGQITKEHVDAVLQRFGFPHLPALAPRADLVPQVHDAIFGAA